MIWEMTMKAFYTTLRLTDYLGAEAINVVELENSNLCLIQRQLF